MKICLAGKHRFPASDGGPSGGRVFDFLAKGLAQLGHEVLYCPGKGANASPPPGVTIVNQPNWDVNVLHCHSYLKLCPEAESREVPWVATCHTDLATWNMSREAARENWIFVSRTLAATYGSSRYVLNGIDPDELIYSASKERYLLFVCALRLAERKGLDLAIDLAREHGLPLVVAGSDPDRRVVDRISEKCHSAGASYVGEIRGEVKAALFAGARALLFPTQLNEAFGLVIAESLMSGTPVICSNRGACPEVVSSDVGFVCETRAEYLQALQQIQDGAISPDRCRALAMDRFHYDRMARDYLSEYECELGD